MIMLQRWPRRSQSVWRMRPSGEFGALGVPASPPPAPWWRAELVRCSRARVRSAGARRLVGDSRRRRRRGASNVCWLSRWGFEEP